MIRVILTFQISAMVALGAVFVGYAAGDYWAGVVFALSAVLVITRIDRGQMDLWFITDAGLPPSCVSPQLVSAVFNASQFFGEGQFALFGTGGDVNWLLVVGVPPGFGRELGEQRPEVISKIISDIGLIILSNAGLNKITIKHAGYRWTCDVGDLKRCRVIGLDERDAGEC